MYYKIENQKCKVYKKLHALRTKEYQMKKDNEYLIRKRIGFNLKWENYLGYPDQQGFNRLPDFQGFEFEEPNKADPLTWRLHPKYSGVFIPNTRTKAGREMKKFLSKDLQQSMCFDVFDILGLEVMGRFKIPYMEICGETILLYVDENHKPKDKNIIEITSTEFEKIRKEKAAA